VRAVLKLLRKVSNLDPNVGEVAGMPRPEESEDIRDAKMEAIVEMFVKNRLDQLDMADSLRLKLRRDFPDPVIRDWCKTVDFCYGGMCPHCFGISNGYQRIAGEQHVPIGDCRLDHFSGKHLNGTKDGWPVCHPCNVDLSAAIAATGERVHSHWSVMKFWIFQQVHQERLDAEIEPEPNLFDD
jgi:hypothetical protein